MADWLIRNGTVVTLGPRNRVIGDGAVLVKDGIIEAVGKVKTVAARARGTQVLDARGGVIMPGFINAHTHLYSTFARGLASERAPRDFMEILKGLWWPLDRALTAEDLRSSALAALLDCIRNGTTTVIDHHEGQNSQPGSLGVLAAALRRMGVRGCLCLGVSDRDGKGLEGLQENIRFVEKLQRRRRADGLVSAMFGLHALFTVNKRTLASVVAAANGRGTGIHSHIAEDRSDQALNRRRYGKSVVQRLHDAGGLNERTLAIHCVKVTAADIRRLAAAGACVVHNPQSNMNNAVGVAPVSGMLAAGITVGLGTDGMTTDMRQEVRACHLLHKHAAGDPDGFMAESCRLLLENNARIASRLFDRPVGMLKKGACADVIVLDYDPPTPMKTANFNGHFLFGLCGEPVTTTMVQGRLLMHNGRMQGVNERRIRAEARRRAQGLWKRMRRK